MGSCVNRQEIGRNKGKMKIQFINHIKIGSLNYSGIQESPYEFYETESQQQKQMTNLFGKVCQINIKNFNDPKFKWKMGKMDKEWHSRFTPIYHRLCGVKQNKMMNQEEFIKCWDEAFEREFKKFEGKIYGKLSGAEKEKTIQEQKEQCKLFDLSVYETILKYVYKVENIKGIKQKPLNAQPYIEYQHKKFHKAFLDEELKLIKTIDEIRKEDIDVFFIQEANQKLVELLKKHIDKEFYIIEKLSKNNSSIILVRRARFPKVKDFRTENDNFMTNYNEQCGKDAEKDLNWNEQTVFQVIGKIILLSVHLTSKKQQNENQKIELKESLTKLIQLFPEHHIIIGGDLNSDFEFGYDLKISEDKLKKIYVYPDKDNDITVFKKRTLIQAQKHKANDLSDGVKDYIVSTLAIRQAKVVTINNIQITKGKNMLLIPNAEHPYDHFLVFGIVELP